MPGASVEEPGRRYDDVPELKVRTGAGRDWHKSLISQHLFRTCNTCGESAAKTAFDPSTLFKCLAVFQEIFTDVFPPYLGKYFDLSGATMFRFPLRTPSMAMESELSDKSISVEDLDNLLTKFRSELFDCLLFVNNVNRISISEISKGSQRMQVSVAKPRSFCLSGQCFAHFQRDTSSVVFMLHGENQLHAAFPG